MDDIIETEVFPTDPGSKPGISEKLDNGFRVIEIAPGGSFEIPQDYPALAGTEEVREQGIFPDAVLRAIIDLGQDYQLFLFDRGEDAQDLPEPLVATDKKCDVLVEDRFFVLDSFGRMSVGIASGANVSYPKEKETGFTQMCQGERKLFGRSYKSTINTTQQMSRYVSNKHFALDIDFDGTITIIDCVSTNGTKILLNPTH